MSITRRMLLAYGLWLPVLVNAQSGGGLTAEERAAMPPSPGSAASVEKASPPSGPQLALYSESAYQVGDDQWMIDVVVGTPAYITAHLTDAAGEPMPDVTVSAATRDGSALVTAQATETDALGEATFGVRPFEAGEEVVTVRGKGQKTSITLNVIDDAALDWQGMDEAEGITPWKTLLSSRVRYREDYTLDVDYSEPARALSGEEVRLVGFMMPLEPTDQQKHFLLVSTPPSCFFHVPGGPAGAVEVFAERGIEVQWEPIMLSGRFQLVRERDAGLIYRLEDAQLRERERP